MADNGSAQSQDTKMWPLPSFHFKVTLGSVGEISFSEVSGLETDSRKSPTAPVTAMISQN